MAESYLEKSIWSIWTTNIISGWMVLHIQILLSLSIGYKLDSHSTYFHRAVYLIGTVLSVPMNRTATAIESSPVRNWISSSFCVCKLTLNCNWPFDLKMIGYIAQGFEAQWNECRMSPIRTVLYIYIYIYIFFLSIFPISIINTLRYIFCLSMGQRK